MFETMSEYIFVIMILFACHPTDGAGGADGCGVVVSRQGRQRRGEVT